MERKEIEEKVKDVIRDKFLWVFEEHFTTDDALLKDIGFDSLDVVELELEIEKAFGFNYFENYLTSSSKLKDVVDFVYKLKNK